MATNQHWPAPVSPRCFQTKWMCASHFSVFTVYLPNEASHFQCLFLKWYSQKCLVRASGWCAFPYAPELTSSTERYKHPLGRLIANEDEDVQFGVTACVSYPLPEHPHEHHPALPHTGPGIPSVNLGPRAPEAPTGAISCVRAAWAAHTFPALLGLPAAWKPVLPSAHLQ